MNVGCMYPLLPWQMDDLTPFELEAMVETVKTLAGAPRL